MTFEQRLEIHPELKECNKGAVEKAIALVEACCQGKGYDFSILDRDAEVYQAFKVLVFGKPHFPETPPSTKLGSGYMPSVPKHADELCPRSFDDSNKRSAENSGVFVKALGQRGPKFSNTPNDLIRDLGINQNLGARKIERELRERGFIITVRTVSRRLRTLRSLPLFEN